MRFFPVRVMIICMILPGVVYTISVNLMNHYLENYYRMKVENTYLSNIDSIVDGKISLGAAVEGNIKKLMRSDLLVKKSLVVLDILVITEDGKIIYPLEYGVSKKIAPGYYNNNLDLAKSNWDAIDKGLNIKIDLALSGILKTIILLLLISLFLIIFISIYLRGVKKAIAYETESRREMEKLRAEDEKHRKIAHELKGERIELFKQIDSLNNKYRESRVNEEEMFEEMVELEEKLHSYIELKKDNQAEIDNLEKKIGELGRKKGGAGRKKDFYLMAKRFEALYKNITMDKKAIEGFWELNEELQIKAEEVIHQLNHDFEKVVIKRKVFSGKKSKNTSFEVIFAYSGRLYFSRNSENRIKVLIIGTKKTQNKDMDCLHNL